MSRVEFKLIDRVYPPRICAATPKLQVGPEINHLSICNTQHRHALGISRLHSDSIIQCITIPSNLFASVVSPAKKDIPRMTLAIRGRVARSMFVRAKTENSLRDGRKLSSDLTICSLQPTNLTPMQSDNVFQICVRE